jgi:hypothetical protein
MLTAEAIIAAIKLANSLVTMFKGRAKFADGTLLTQEHVDAAWRAADAPFERIEKRAQDELDKLGDA